MAFQCAHLKTVWVNKTELLRGCGTWYLRGRTSSGGDPDAQVTLWRWRRRVECKLCCMAREMVMRRYIGKSRFYFAAVWINVSGPFGLLVQTSISNFLCSQPLVAFSLVYSLGCNLTVETNKAVELLKMSQNKVTLPISHHHLPDIALTNQRL